MFYKIKVDNSTRRYLKRRRNKMSHIKENL